MSKITQGERPAAATARRKRSLHRTSASIRTHARSDNVGRLLLVSYRHFERVAMQILTEMGFDDLRMTHFQVLPHVREEGARTSDVALAMNITKQGVGQIAADLEAAGYLTRVPDLHDGRAKLLLLTGKGKALVDVLPLAVTRAEGVFEEIIGARAFAWMKEGLQGIVVKHGHDATADDIAGSNMLAPE